MAMRVQLSLQFTDEDLFDNFITPYKEGRVLNSLIIKCLSAYHYSESIRDQIEGFSEDGNQSNSTLCDSIKASLLMQDFLANDLQDIVSNDNKDIENILNKTDDFSKLSMIKKSAPKTNTTGFGSSILQITSNPPQVATSPQDSSKVDTNLQDSTKVDTNSQESIQDSVDTASQLEDYERQVEAVKNYADSITKGVDILAEGINRLAQCIVTLESEKKQLENENELLRVTGSTVSHHAPFDTAVIFSAQYLLGLRESLKASTDSLDKVLTSAIHMESDLV